jgi:hypothetical protein
MIAIIGTKVMAADVGLYDVSDATHPKVFRDEIVKITIISQSNDNKRYFLAFHAAHFFSLPCSRIGLVVGNKIIRFNSQGEDEKGRCTSIETTIDDPNVIPQVEEHFHAEVVKRQHPGHQMLVEFIPDKSKFRLGEPVTANLRITNIGDREFSFMEGGRQRGSRDNQFAFSAELVGSKMIPDIGNPLNYGGLARLVTMKPGRHHVISVDLGRWFEFNQTGTYNLRGSYYMEFTKPNSQDFHPIWEDFACGEFTIEITN